VKKARLWVTVVVLIGAVTVVLVSRKRHAPSTGVLSEAQEPALSGSEDRKTEDPAAVGARPSRVSLSLDLLRKQPEQPPQRRPVPRGLRARDPGLERFLEKQPRDGQLEEQLTLKLLDRFSADPNVSVGQVACTQEFCRADILASRLEEDRYRHYADGMASILEGERRRMFLLEEDDAGTRLTFYFGREAGWRPPLPPDFHPDPGI